MPVKLDDDKIKYVIREKEKGTLNATIAESMKISSRHVRRLWAKYRSTGSLPTISSGGRPATKTISDEEVEMVLAECRRGCSGVGRVTKALADKNISGRTVYNIMKKHGLVESCPAKAKKRKWVRFERQYSNAMWHTDWHVMKDFRVRDLNLITYLDDASRCVTGYGVFKEATGLNAVEVLRQAILAFGTPASILSDNGSCFVGVRSGTPKGTWTPTIFESELLDRGIQLINSRPYHPQTNGKLERFHRTLETEVRRHDSLDDFVTYYNERRLHWSLDIDNHQTPLKAFHDKATYETIRVDNPNWMEVDIHG